MSSESKMPSSSSAESTSSLASSSATTQPTPPSSSSSSSSSSSISASTATLPKPKPEIRPIPSYLRPLEFVGIPKSVLAWKPRLPSRNWSIFLVTVSTLSYLYYDDRKQCKQIRQDYIEKVRHLSQVPMKPSEFPTRLSVYATRSPGDDDHDKALLYFKKYVKPILVAAGMDWIVINGTSHGGLARALYEQIQERRRKLAGLEPWRQPVAGAMPIVFQPTPQEELERELQGGVVLVGRPAYKEWAWALKHGWGTPLEVVKRDRDDELAQELAEDGAFDEVPVDNETDGFEQELSEKDRAIAALGQESTTDGAGAPLPSNISVPYGSMNLTSMMQTSSSSSKPKQTKTEAEKLAERIDRNLLESPLQIPAQPPICFVDFTNLVGFRNIPLRMYQFFRQRDKVRHGAELGLTIVMGTKETAREFEPGESRCVEGQVATTPPQGGDLDWGIESEERYPPYFLKTLKNTEEEKEKYYKSLPQKLKDARDLARGVREPSKLEIADPPLTETQLGEERFKKEKAWRNAIQGFDIIKPEQGVEWDQRWRGNLLVFQLSDETRQQIDRDQAQRRQTEQEQEKREQQEQREQQVQREQQAQREQEENL